MPAERCSLLFLLNFLCDCFYWLSRFRGVVVWIKPQLKLFLFMLLALLVLTTCSSSSIDFFPEWRRTCFLFHWLFQQRNFCHIWKGKVVPCLKCLQIESNWMSTRVATCCMRNDIFYRKANLQVPDYSLPVFLVSRFTSLHWPLKESIRCPSLRSLCGWSVHLLPARSP